ncbi:MAG: class I SAM-dependent methyltransferase, partial [Ktedonobacteraceae bacterium]
MTIKTQPRFTLLSAPHWTDYTFLDSGAGSKLEQFGQYRFIRPEPQAMWSPACPQEIWQAADAVFRGDGKDEGGKWQFKRPIEPRWVMHYKNLKFWAQVTPFRHVGFFPEQASQWDWMEEIIKKAQRPLRVLNLFGYTGLATLVAARAGAVVTHVDASKQTISWARENQLLSGLEDRPIRWLVDDALKYVQREVRRHAEYD